MSSFMHGMISFAHGHQIWTLKSANRLPCFWQTYVVLECIKENHLAMPVRLSAPYRQPGTCAGEETQIRWHCRLLGRSRGLADTWRCKTTAIPASRWRILSICQSERTSSHKGPYEIGQRTAIQLHHETQEIGVSHKPHTWNSVSAVCKGIKDSTAPYRTIIN